MKECENPLSVELVVTPNSLRISGCVTPAEIQPIIDQWFTAIAQSSGPGPAVSLKITVGAITEQSLPTPNQEHPSMQLTDSQKVDIAVAGADKKGFPAAVETITFTSSDATVAAVTPDPADPSKASVVAGNPGTAQIAVTADALIGDGENILTGTLDIVVVAGSAATLSVTAGVPTEQ
jgi:hypothetical protein